MRDTGPNVPPVLNQLAAVSWRILVVGALALAVVYVLSRLQSVMLGVFLAFLVVAVLAPLRNLLERHGVKHIVAVWTVFVLAAVLFVGLLSAVIVPFILEAGELVDNIGQGIDELLAWLSDGPLGIPPETVQQYRSRLETAFQENMQGLAGGLIGPTTAGIGVIVSLLLSIPLIFFFLKDSRPMNRWLLGWVSLRHRDRVEVVISRAWDRVGRFVRGTALVAGIDAVFIGAGLLIMGIPLAGSLIVLTFVTAFIPIIGALAAGGAAVLVALVSEGPTEALIVLGIVILVQQLEGNVISPLVVGHVVRLHPVAILLAISIGGTLGGILGAFMAVPLTAFVYGVLAEIREPDLANFGP